MYSASGTRLHAHPGNDDDGNEKLNKARTLCSNFIKKFTYATL